MNLNADIAGKKSPFLCPSVSSCFAFDKRPITTYTYTHIPRTITPEQTTQKPNMTPKPHNNSTCIIFDMDGTLVDSEALANRALLDLLPEIDETVESLIARYRGGQFAVIMDDIAQRHKFKLPDNFEPAYRAHARKLFDAELKAMPGAYDMLASFPYTKCLASSAPMVKINQALAVTGLAQFFGEKTYSAYQINSWKPEPDLFLHAAKQMGFTPENCIVVEDSDVGVEAGQRAGMTVFKYDPLSDKQHADGYIPLKHLSDLPDKITAILT